MRNSVNDSQPISTFFVMFYIHLSNGLGDFFFEKMNM